MVTILPANKGFGSRFSDTFLPSLQKGMDRFLEQDAAKEKEAREIARKKETAKALGLPEVALEPSVQAALLKEQGKDKRNDALMKLLSKGRGIDQGVESDGQEPTSLGGGLSEDDILAIGALNPQVAGLIQKQNESSQSQKEFGHKQSEKFAEKLRSESERANEVIDAVKEIKKISKKKGAVGANARNLAFTYLKDKESPFANLFQTKDTQALISATKTLAGGGVKEIFNKPTEREFFWFENILPDILKDAPTNEKAADYFDKIARSALRRQEIFDEIVEKNKGYRPIDIDRQVRERMAPEMKKLIDEGEKLRNKQYTLQKLPDPSKYNGKVAEDNEGRRYRSNGTIWEPM